MLMHSCRFKSHLKLPCTANSDELLTEAKNPMTPRARLESGSSIMVDPEVLSARSSGPKRHAQRVPQISKHQTNADSPVLYAMPQAEVRALT